MGRSFPLLLMATALWLYTTVVWADTFGPGFELANETAADADEAKAVDEPNP
ncbi:MAG: hypothetical protein ACE1Y9_00750 [Acidimicrobiia bacterium]